MTKLSLQQIADALHQHVLDDSIDVDCLNRHLFVSGLTVTLNA